MAFGGGGGGYRHEHNSWAIGVLSEGQGLCPGKFPCDFSGKIGGNFGVFFLNVGSFGGYLLEDGAVTLPETNSKST